MGDRPREPADIERDVDSNLDTSVEQDGEGDRTDAILGADDTGMVRDERDIFEGESAAAEEESSSNSP